jgi:serine/threonine-protein kinase
VGQVIADKYHLTEVHAGGAFGTVFQANQFFCGHFVRPVAVKVSHQTGLTDESAGYLFRDALILAQLLAGGHAQGKQHLVPIFDMGLLPQHEGRGFLVMEYVEGDSLLAHLQAAGRVGVTAGLRYVKEICRGLAVVHGQGAVHRDLKPDNILLDRAGVVRLVDFGLAGFTDPQLGFAPGSVGTFTYMAPETLRGQSTPAADMYGVGLIMYEMFAGGGPHLSAPWPSGGEEKDREEHERIKETLVFPPPSEAHNEIRNEYRWLDGLILHCLEIDPARRFADAGQLLAALETCAAGGSLPEPAGFPAPPGASFPAESEEKGPSRTEVEDLFREVRKLLARQAFDQVIDRLDIHRPAEWQALDQRAARTLRALGQAYLGRDELASARECFEQLRIGQKEQAVLPRQEYAAALSDLVKCYRGLDLAELAEDCQREARALLE